MAQWARKKRRTRAVACWTSTLAWDGERVRAVAPTAGEGVVNGQGLTLAEVAQLLRNGQAVRVTCHPHFLGEVAAEMEAQRDRSQ